MRVNWDAVQRASRGNFIDRAISFFDPVRAVERQKSRITLAISGGYTAGRKDRRQTMGWRVPQSADPNSAILGQDQHKTIRDRVRDDARNNPIVAGTVLLFSSHVIGQGLRVDPNPNSKFLKLTEEQVNDFKINAETLFGIWANSVDCHVSRTHNFYGAQVQALEDFMISGEHFTKFAKFRRELPFFLKVLPIESDRICNKDYALDTTSRTAGVHLDENLAPVGYDVLDAHPDDARSTSKKYSWTTIPAWDKDWRPNVLHLRKQDRTGQVRSTSMFAPTVELIHQIGQCIEYELLASALASAFTIFITSADGNASMQPMVPTSETGSSTTDQDYKIGGGAIVGLRKGETVTSAAPGRPNPSFDPFISGMLRFFGMAVGIPYEMVIRQFNSSYTASQAALLEAWQTFMLMRSWFAREYCQKIYELVLFELVSQGKIHAPGFLADPFIRAAYSQASWIGPAKGMIDEVKEIKAARERVALSISTLKDETAMLTGGDWESKIPQRAKEEKVLAAARLASASTITNTNATVVGNNTGGPEKNVDVDS